MPDPAPIPPNQPDASRRTLPIPLWQALLIFLAASIVSGLLVVGLREGLGLGVPSYVAGGMGGLMGIWAVFWLARRRREAADSSGG